MNNLVLPSARVRSNVSIIPPLVIVNSPPSSSHENDLMNIVPLPYGKETVNETHECPRKQLRTPWASKRSRVLEKVMLQERLHYGSSARIDKLGSVNAPLTPLWNRYDGRPVARLVDQRFSMVFSPFSSLDLTSKF